MHKEMPNSNSRLRRVATAVLVQAPLRVLEIPFALVRAIDRRINPGTQVTQEEVDSVNENPYDFAGEETFWEIANNQRFQTAVQSLARVEEFRHVGYCREAIAANKFDDARRAEAVATAYRELWPVMRQYAAYYEQSQRKAS